MSLTRNAYAALCRGILLFQRELASLDMKASITINLDPIDFAAVMHSADPLMMSTAEQMPDGSVRIMDAIVRARRLRDDL